MKDIIFLTFMHKEISFSPPFISKIADLAENVRLEGQKQRCRNLEKSLSIQEFIIRKYILSKKDNVCLTRRIVIHLLNW